MKKPLNQTKRIFGKTLSGETAYLYTLQNKNGIVAKITNFGAILAELWVPDKNGTLENMVLGFENPIAYEKANTYAGAMVGRIAGRLTYARFNIDNTCYQVSQNEGTTHLHGGKLAMDKKLWQAEPKMTESGEALELSYFSPEGEEGYPGNVHIVVRYTLTDGNELQIAIRAKTDAVTPLCLTNHSYFNLSGANKEDISNHTITINANSYAEIDKNFCFTGKRISVQKGNNDFRKAVRMIDYCQKSGGHGEMYFLENNEKLSLVATVSEPISGRLLEVRTTQPCIQFYNGKYLNTNIKAIQAGLYKPLMAFV